MQQNPDQQNQVRIDVTASGNSLDTTAIAALIARTLKTHMPEHNVQVVSQDQNAQTRLDELDTGKAEKIDFGPIFVVAAKDAQFQDLSQIPDLQTYNVSGLQQKRETSMSQNNTRQ